MPPTQIPGDGQTPCFCDSLPSGPDQVVLIFNIEGHNFARRMRGGRQEIHPGIKLIVRTLDNTGYDLANKIALALDGIAAGPVTVPEDSSIHYVQSVYRLGTILPLGEEVGNKRQRWSINARVAFTNQEPSLG